jgi:DMSO/TMAO reductase YedYZ molybdopterin-dependent catalytic subunit
MSEPINRRNFLGVAALAGLSAGAGAGAGTAAAAAAVADDGGGGGGAAARAEAGPSRPFLTDAGDFVDVSRGRPRPFTLEGQALANARLTPETWRLEIVGDESAEVARPARLENGTALSLDALKAMGEAHGVKYFKAMQCNNIPFPLGQGLWEGVPLREVLRSVGKVGNVRRIYYWGFHNNDPAQLFQSSLSFNRAMETPPWEPPPLVAYRLNGRDIPLKRGGPVRMVVPWAHGFKSIKWLQRIVLTNDYKANDTYALQNNDPESHLKTAAYLRRDSPSFEAGTPALLEGTAMVGPSGLERVESWVRPAADGPLNDDDPAWASAPWKPCELMSPPDAWDALLPGGVSTKEIWGFDPRTGKPKSWPLPYSTVPFSVTIAGLRPGAYELWVRAVDLNGFAQPEPRPYQKSGMNRIPCQHFTVTT